jgi:hypothetical protein
MTEARTIEQEIDINYDAFRRIVGGLMAKHAGETALLHDGQLIGIYTRTGDAYAEGKRRFVDGLFSLQPVEVQPIDLGFYSRVGG